MEGVSIHSMTFIGHKGLRPVARVPPRSGKRLFGDLEERVEDVNKGSPRGFLVATNIDGC